VDAAAYPKRAEQVGPLAALAAFNRRVARDDIALASVVVEQVDVDAALALARG